MGNCTFLRSRRTRRPKLTSWNWMRDFCKVPPTTRSQQTIKNKAQVGLITHTQWFEMLKTSIFLIVAWEKMCKQYVQVVLLQEAKGKVVVKIPTTQKFCSMVLNHRPMLQVKKMSMKILIKAVKFWISWTYPRHLQVLHTKTFFSCLLPNLLHLIFQVFSNHKCWWWEQPLASFWSTWIPEKSSAPFHLIIYTPMFKARTSWVPWCQHYCWAKVKPPRASMFWHSVWRMKERHFSLWNSRAQ